MNKTEALKRVSTLENELTELKKIINSSEKITERVKTYEDACLIKGIDPYNSLPYPDPINKDQIQINTYHKLMVIVDVLNEDKIIDWDDESQKKWYPYFKILKGGLSFDGTTYGGWAGSYAPTAARLSLFSSELAEYYGKQFIELHKVFYNRKK